MRDMVQVRRGRRHGYGGPDIRIGRSQFNRSHGVKTTFDASRLVPILVDEVMPGDTFTCKVHGFARVFSPLDAPIMDNISIETFFFFVPTRLVWTNWVAFQGEHDDAGAQDTTYTIPRLSDGTTPVVAGSLANYMGVPIGTDFSLTVVSALPFRCYRLIYNEWFRDQNLIDESTVDKSDSNDAATYGSGWLFKSAKRHDYFTSCLPYLQKGTAQTVALTGAAEVYTKAGVTTSTDIAVRSDQYSGLRELDASVSRLRLSTDVGTTDEQLFADLTDGTLDVNALRLSTAIQRLLERDARGGTRYTEKIKAQFGVTNPDFRLQRPEFLGGGKSWINIDPVANTSSIDSAASPEGADVFQGELRGVGTGRLSGHGWAKSFTEHGYIIGLMRARADVTYFQGLDRLWSRDTLYDFYVPALAHLGEQAVLNKEIYVSNASATDDAVFGYQERWAEYRTKHSLVTGKFSPDATGALSHWHLAEDFASLPTLNQTFIEDQTPMSRVTTIDSEPDFMADIWFDYRCARPMPVRSIPSLMAGRF